MTNFNLLLISFSKIFDMIERSEIGLYDVTTSKDLPSLGTTIISAIFHCFGK